MASTGHKKQKRDGGRLKKKKKKSLKLGKYHEQKARDENKHGEGRECN